MTTGYSVRFATYRMTIEHGSTLQQALEASLRSKTATDGNSSMQGPPPLHMQFNDSVRHSGECPLSTACKFHDNSSPSTTIDELQTQQPNWSEAIRASSRNMTPVSSEGRQEWHCIQQREGSDRSAGALASSRRAHTWDGATPPDPYQRPTLTWGGPNEPLMRVRAL